MKAAALNDLSARECTLFCFIYQFGCFVWTVKSEFCFTVEVISQLGLFLPQDGLIAFLFRPLSNFHFHLLLHTNTGACLISQRSSSEKAVHFSTLLILWVTWGFHAHRDHTYASAFTKETTHGCIGPQKGKGKTETVGLGDTKSLFPLSVLSQCSLRLQIL